MNNIPSLQNPVRYRSVDIGSSEITVEKVKDCFYLRAREPLAQTPSRILDRLLHWAEVRQDQTFVAKRSSEGNWLRLSYGEMLDRVRAIAANLLDYSLGPERPLLILSGNDLEHLQLTLAAYYIGVPVCPVSPAYSIVAKEFSKLRHILKLTSPGLVFASDGELYAKAITEEVPISTPIVVTTSPVQGRHCGSFASLLEVRETGAADKAFSETTANTIAKFLFTSGSTKLPKAVVTTQRMLTTNQQMLLQTFPEFGRVPPVLVDWLPWNHTFGGSHNVGIVLYNGGTLYLDDGKPTPQHFAETLRNLKEIAPTAYLTVPKGWEELVVALESDPNLREMFFSRIKLFFFGGAGLSQAVWDRLDKISEAHCGERIRMMAGLGMTETSPCCTFTTGPLSMAGYVGLPAPGCEVKLAPANGKLEARFRGPHVMPGYWQQPELNDHAFDEEGFYCSGDALCFADEDKPEYGLMFDGRIAEDFKLSTGVFVSVGPLRAKIIIQGGSCIQDVVIAGPNRQNIGLLVFPNLASCRKLTGMPTASAEDVLASSVLKNWLAELVNSVNLDATGLATYIAWAHLVTQPASLEAGELTDKGSLNQSMVLSRRAQLVDTLYSDPNSMCVLGQPR